MTRPDDLLLQALDLLHLHEVPFNDTQWPRPPDRGNTLAVASGTNAHNAYF